MLSPLKLSRHNASWSHLRDTRSDDWHSFGWVSQSAVEVHIDTTSSPTNCSVPQKTSQEDHMNSSSCTRTPIVPKSVTSGTFGSHKRLIPQLSAALWLWIYIYLTCWRSMSDFRTFRRTSDPLNQWVLIHGQLHDAWWYICDICYKTVKSALYLWIPCHTHPQICVHTILTDIYTWIWTRLGSRVTYPSC